MSLQFKPLEQSAHHLSFHQPHPSSKSHSVNALSLIIILPDYLIQRNQGFYKTSGNASQGRAAHTSQLQKRQSLIGQQYGSSFIRRMTQFKRETNDNGKPQKAEVGQQCDFEELMQQINNTNACTTEDNRNEQFFTTTNQNYNNQTVQAFNIDQIGDQTYQSNPVHQMSVYENPLQDIHLLRQSSKSTSGIITQQLPNVNRSSSAVNHYYAQATSQNFLRNVTKRDTHIRLTHSLYKFHQDKQFDTKCIQFNIRPYSRQSGSSLLLRAKRASQQAYNSYENKQAFNKLNSSQSQLNASKTFSKGGDGREGYTQLQTNVNNHQALIPMILSTEELLQSSTDGNANDQYSQNFNNTEEYQKRTILSRQGGRNHAIYKYSEDNHPQHTEEERQINSGTTDRQEVSRNKNHLKLNYTDIMTDGQQSSCLDSAKRLVGSSYQQPQTNKHRALAKQNDRVLSPTFLKRWSSKKKEHGAELNTMSDIHITDQDAKRQYTINERPYSNSTNRQKNQNSQQNKDFNKQFEHQKPLSKSPIKEVYSKKGPFNRLNLLRRKNNENMDISNTILANVQPVVNFAFHQIPDFEELKVNSLIDSKIKQLNIQGIAEGRKKPFSMSENETSFILNQEQQPLFIGSSKKSPGFHPPQNGSRINIVNSRSCQGYKNIQFEQALLQQTKNQKQVIKTLMNQQQMLSVLGYHNYYNSQDATQLGMTPDDLAGIDQPMYPEQNNINEQQKVFVVPQDWASYQALEYDKFGNFSTVRHEQEEQQQIEVQEESPQNIYSNLQKPDQNKHYFEGNENQLQQPSTALIAQSTSGQRSKMQSKIIYSINKSSKNKNSANQRSKNGGIYDSQAYIRRSLDSRSNSRPPNVIVSQANLNLDGLINVKAINKSTISSSINQLNAKSTGSMKYLEVNRNNLESAPNSSIQASHEHLQPRQQKIEQQKCENINNSENQTMEVLHQGQENDQIIQEDFSVTQISIKVDQRQNHSKSSTQQNFYMNIAEYTNRAEHRDDSDTNEFNTQNNKAVKGGLVGRKLRNNSNSSRNVNKRRQRIHSNFQEFSNKINDGSDCNSQNQVKEPLLKKYSTLKIKKDNKLTKLLKSRAKSAHSEHFNPFLSVPNQIIQEGSLIQKQEQIIITVKEASPIKEHTIKDQPLESFINPLTLSKQDTLYEAIQLDLLKTQSNEEELQLQQRRSSRNVLSKLQGKSVTPSSVKESHRSPENNQNAPGSPRRQPGCSSFKTKIRPNLGQFVNSNMTEDNNQSEELIIKIERLGSAANCAAMIIQDHDSTLTIEDGKKSLITINDEDIGFFQQKNILTGSIDLQNNLSAYYQQERKSDNADGIQIQAAMMEKVIVKSPGKQITTDHVFFDCLPDISAMKRQASKMTHRIPDNLTRRSSSLVGGGGNHSSHERRRSSIQNSDLPDLQDPPSPIKRRANKSKDGNINSKQINRFAKQRQKQEEPKYQNQSIHPVQLMAIEDFKNNELAIQPEIINQGLKMTKSMDLARHGRAPPSVIMKNKLAMKQRQAQKSGERIIATAESKSRTNNNQNKNFDFINKLNQTFQVIPVARSRLNESRLTQSRNSTQYGIYYRSYYLKSKTPNQNFYQSRPLQNNDINHTQVIYSNEQLNNSHKSLKLSPPNQKSKASEFGIQQSAKKNQSHKQLGDIQVVGVTIQ